MEISAITDSVEYRQIQSAILRYKPRSVALHLTDAQTEKFTGLRFVSQRILLYIPVFFFRLFQVSGRPDTMNPQDHGMQVEIVEIAGESNNNCSCISHACCGDILSEDGAV